MTLSIKDVPRKDLPDPHDTHGFKIMGDDGEMLMFFHWAQDGELKQDFLAPDEAAVAGHPVQVLLGVRPSQTTYADVLAVLPDRLAEFGYEKETDAILGEVVGMYGAG